MSLFNREEVIDQNFTRCVADEEFPKAKTELFVKISDQAREAGVYNISLSTD